jgi:hypothetical protein
VAFGERRWDAGRCQGGGGLPSNPATHLSPGPHSTPPKHGPDFREPASPQVLEQSSQLHCISTQVGYETTPSTRPGVHDWPKASTPGSPMPRQPGSPLLVTGAEGLVVLVVALHRSTSSASTCRSDDFVYGVYGVG